MQRIPACLTRIRHCVILRGGATDSRYQTKGCPMTFDKLAFALLLAGGSLLAAQQKEEERPDQGGAPPPMRIVADIPYADTKNPRHQLDLYLPAKPRDEKPLPVVIFFHGTFQNADKKAGRIFAPEIVSGGRFAMASVGYRLGDEVQWPAQIHDAKAAVRWLRANAAKHNLNPDRIAAMGTSAGGHLATILGVTDKVAGLEGTIGEHLKVSSRVTCVVDMFGATDLLALSPNTRGRGSPYGKLLGGPIAEKLDLAKEASPITYVTRQASPILIIHGTVDQTVPFAQSEAFVAAMKKAKAEAWLIPVTDGRHGNFQGPEMMRRVMIFFDKYLRDADVELKTEAFPNVTE